METAAAGCPVPHPAAGDPNPNPTCFHPNPHEPSCGCCCRCRAELLLQKENEERDKWWNENIRPLVKKALVFSSILVAATVVVALCSIGQPERLVWRLSLLLCCAAFIRSRLLEVTVSAATMLLAIVSGFTAALLADAVVDTKIGVLLAHLTSHLAAGMLGYALAKHFQHKGLEVTPATVPPPKKLTESERQENESNVVFVRILAWCFNGTITAVCAAVMACVVWYRAEFAAEYLVLLAFGPMAFALLMWSMFLGVVFSQMGEGRLGYFVGLGLVSDVLFPMSWTIFGDVGAMVVTWLGILAWTGCFGYVLCVYNSFKQHEEDAKVRGAAKQSEVPKIIAELPVPENNTGTVHPIQIMDD